MQKTALGLLLLVVLAAVFGWWAAHMRTAQVPILVPPQQGSDALSGVATSSGALEHVEDTNLYHIDLLYPAHTPLAPAADARARATVEQGLAGLIAQFKQDGNFANLTAEDIAYQHIGGDRRYTLVATYQGYQSSSTVSYVFTVYEDTLGAHPNGYYITFVFDRSGTQLALSDLFATSTDYLQTLSAVATAQVQAEITRRAGAGAAMTLFADGLSPNADNFQNWAIDGGTMLIEIPPYQAAAYAAGSFEVRVPLSQLPSLQIQ